MKQFGDKVEFGIDCAYYLDEYKDDPDVLAHPERYDTGGSIYFWVNGKNLFLYKGYGPEATYSFDLNVLVEFFCDKLHLLIKDDPFPEGIKSTTVFDMMEEIKLVEGPDNDVTKYLDVDWDNIDTDLNNKVILWGDNHGLYTNRDGSFLPDLFMRKVNNQIEVSWLNDFAHRNTEGEVYFEYEKGIEYVDLKLFKDTVIEFCLDFINRCHDKYPEQMNRYRENLQKAMAVEV